MGIFIYLAISKSTTQEEWEDVYQETLELVDKFPFAEKRKITIKGVETICLVPTREREFTYGWNKEKIRVGWDAVGDYKYMITAEDYFLPRDLIEEQEIEFEAGDAMYGVLPAYLNYNWNDSKLKRIYSLWEGKTQGEPYHMYLLAIACLIEDRLREKAFVYGDITGGQCLKAVTIANKYLKNKINTPDRCDMDRFFRRVSKMELPDDEKLKIFERLYLGNQDEVFGQFIREHFSDEVQENYWKKEFSVYVVGTLGFDNVFSRYMQWGGTLRKLCECVRCTDKNGNDLYRQFIIRIMDAKLHLKEKDCRNSLQIDQNEQAPYGISTLLAQFAFAGARNKKIDRYIPIDEIKSVLMETFSDKCDVTKIINDYLEEEEKQQKLVPDVENTTEKNFEEGCTKDVSSMFEQIMEKKMRQLQEQNEKYDICDYQDLIFYENGDSIRPSLKESLRKSYLFYHGLIKEETFIQLMQKDARDRCCWIIEQNRNILIRDIDWEKIFTDIEENEESFERYYPMVRVELNSNQLVDMTKAIILNDELYEYCEKL